MTTDFRALCAELLSVLENEGYAHWIVPPDRDELCLRARAALAQPEPQSENCPGCEGTPAANNSPCAVCGQLAQPEPEGATDEELLRLAATTIEPYESSGIAVGEYEPETECAVEVYGSELISFARAVLARWGHHALPVPQQEVK